MYIYLKSTSVQLISARLQYSVVLKYLTFELIAKTLTVVIIYYYTEFQVHDILKPTASVYAQDILKYNIAKIYDHVSIF